MGTGQERSIIDLGRGSSAITLPKPWLRYRRLQPGERMLVVTGGGLRAGVIKRKPAVPEGPEPREGSGGQPQA